MGGDETERPPDSERAKRARARVEAEGGAWVDERKPDGSGARGWRWPPFEPGHELSIRHGAMSDRKVDPVAAELAGGLLADRPDLERHPEAVAAWARVEARCLLLESWFAEHGLLDEKGKPTASESLLSSSERLAMQLRERLGLDPRSEAALAQEQSEAARSVVDLDALRARGREALKARRELDAGGHVRDGGGRVRGDGAGS